tara:strand:+ start:605 stop:1108 length:504 start_codon:yes stop_codon:yes gene_type:complete
MFVLYIFLLSAVVSMIFAKSSLTSTAGKALIVMLLMHGHLVVWSTFKTVSGYPTAAELPDEFEVIYARVVEEHDSKFIELWVKHDASITGKFLSFFSMHFEIDDLSRVYRMPYSKENHEFVNEMTERIMQGNAVGVKFKDKEEKRNLDLREGEKDFRVEYENQVITK